MAEIKHQQLGGSPEIVSASIHIPDDADMGTGTFTTIFKPSVLPAKKAIASIMVNAPSFQISATVNPNTDLPVLLGKADGSGPKDRVVFRLPTFLEDPKAQHSLEIAFAKWRILGASLDGKFLSKKS